MNLPKLTPQQMVASLLLVILGASWLCLSPTLGNDYVNFDDTKYVVFNPAVKSLSKESVASMFTTLSGRQYHYVPLTLLSYALEFRFHDLAPRIYHANNLFLHLLNTALCFWLVLVLFKDIRLAAIVALLFGIHPMHVESVAWISERKDLLYSFFYLAGLVFYVKYVDAGKRRLLGISFILFVLSLLSKPMAVTFPLILCVIDRQRARRISMPVFLEKLPFLLGSFIVGLITLLPKDFPVVEFEKGYSWFERLLMASHNLFQYVLKAAYPQNLSAYYPLPARVNGSLPPVFLAAPLLAVLLLGALYVLSKRNARIAFGALYFLLTIVLVLNFFPLGNILMAEHYSYLAYIGIFIIFTELFFESLKSPRFGASFKKILVASAIFWVLLLGFKSYKRTFIWFNSETLWANVLDQYPREAFAYYNLADHYVRLQQFEKAIEQYDLALEADPQYFSAYNNRANMHFLLGRLEEAEADYRSSIAANPRIEMPYANLARLYESLGRHEEAEELLKAFNRLR